MTSRITALLCGLSTALLLSTSSAWAAAPTVTTGDASAITQTSATVSATVNPGGSPVSDCHVAYGTDRLNLGSTAPCATLPGGGTDDVTVSAALSMLAPKTTYFYRFVATNGDGTTTALSDREFTTSPPPAPTAETGDVTPLPDGRVALTGTINPNGLETSCRFEMALTAVYVLTDRCDTFPGSGTSPVAVRLSTSFSGGAVAPGSTIRYRLIAESSSGVTYGAEKTYTVPPQTGGGSGSGGSGGGYGSGGGSGSGGGGAAGRLSLPASVKVKAGKAALKLRCTGTTACRGTLSLKAMVKQGGRSKSISVGRASVNVAAGASATVTVRLSSAARSALRRSHRLTVSVTGAGATRRITLRS